MVEDPPVVAIAFDDDRLDVGPAEVETEVAARRFAAVPAHQVSPVTRV
jgi:hypothetical protein